MSSISGKLDSFFRHGIVPGGVGSASQRPFDQESTEKAHLNCVSKVQGIALSLFHPAKGGLVDAAEEKEGSGGIFD